MKQQLNYTDIVQAFRNKYATEGYPFDHDKHPDPTFNKYEWVKIPVKLNMRHRNIFPFIVAISEILRFEIGATQPEYKLSETHILSKKVEQDEEVGQFRIRTLYAYWKDFVNSTEPKFWEGMGRVVFAKFLYQDNDFNVNNALVDKNDYFVAIDSDKSFWSITEKYHLFKDIKVQRYNNCPSPAVPIISQNGQAAYLLTDKKRDFIGEMHAEDYHTLPLLKHYYPTDWFFLSNELNSYSSQLGKNQRFLNEKYFATFKAIITINLKHLLIDLHIDEKEDNADSHKLVTSQMEKLIEIAKQSDAFKMYITNHHKAALLAIIHETNAFFHKNKNYQLMDDQKQQAIKECLVGDIIAQSSKFIYNLGHEQDVKDIETKAHGVLHKKNNEMRIVKNFYDSQLMNFHANAIQI